MPTQTVPLTRPEKAAGRLFRETQQALLLADFEANPPKQMVPPFVRYFRHPCAKANNISKPLDLKEVYTFSPPYVVYISDVDEETGRESYQAFEVGQVPSEYQSVDPVVEIPANRFGFWTRAGKCPCGYTGRAKTGKFVDAYLRPPLSGRVSR